MRSLASIRSLVIAGLALAFSTGAANHSSAQNAYISATYKVQVEYWFFDTDYYYWSTQFESSNYNDAVYVYNILQAADDAGMLNSVAPNSYWRYIAVDVRMITEYNYPRYQLADTYLPLQNAQTLTRISN